MCRKIYILRYSVNLIFASCRQIAKSAGSRERSFEYNLLCYEDLIQESSSVYAWPNLDEDAASTLCYTSGTTGNPKGVLYSHRLSMLHTYAAALPDALNCSARAVILPAVPMFRVNTWGLPCIACRVGAKREERHAVQSRQGRVAFGVDMKIVGADCMELPWDGATSGDPPVRGPTVVCDYFRNEGDSPPPQLDEEGQGWFPTGDVATIDADGFMQITDRSKDVIKCGGERIGSIDLENIAMAYPAVSQAACIAAKHAKWDERPLLIVVRKLQADLKREEQRPFDSFLPRTLVFLYSGLTGRRRDARDCRAHRSRSENRPPRIGRQPFQRQHPCAR
jgi:acyl-CoA synthetase (AMP-forming)/AMP-acid ligase II